MTVGGEEAGSQQRLMLSAEFPTSADALVTGRADASEPDVTAAPDDSPRPEPDAQEVAGAVALAGISSAVQQLLATSERYHARAEQREGVIDHLRSEVERLRRGERRGLLRPLLAEMCRLRDDLLRQAEDLPEDFDAERARLLLRSYADSVMVALEGNGVVTFVPEDGEPFDPRMHRRVGVQQAGDPGQVGRVARAQRSGYLDLEAVNPIALAEVTLFAATPPAGEPPAGQPGHGADGPATGRPAAETDEKE